MLVFVTGASGFVGGATARELLARGHRVRLLVHRTTPDASMGTVAAARAPDVELVTGALDDEEALARAMAGVDAVVHSAALLGRPDLGEADYDRVNRRGAEAVARAVVRAAVPRLVHVSTIGVLGPGRQPRSEDAPLAPTNGYERSKAAAESAVLAATGVTRRQRDLRVVIARPGFVYGPGDRHAVRLFRAVTRRRFFHIDGGRALYQPVAIDDVAHGVIAAIERGEDGQRLHLVGPETISLADFCGAISQAAGTAPVRLSFPEPLVRLVARAAEKLSARAGRPSPLTESAVDFFVGDRVVADSVTRATLGDLPRTSIREGVDRALAWYRAERLLD
jgi:nucleoside-diphosphate-sugar epimerase